MYGTYCYDRVSCIVLLSSVSWNQAEMCVTLSESLDGLIEKGKFAWQSLRRMCVITVRESCRNGSPLPSYDYSLVIAGAICHGPVQLLKKKPEKERDCITLSLWSCYGISSKKKHYARA